MATKRFRKLFEDFVEKASVSRKDVYFCGRNQEKKRHVYRIRIKAIYH